MITAASQQKKLLLIRLGFVITKWEQQKKLTCHIKVTAGQKDRYLLGGLQKRSKIERNKERGDKTLLPNVR